VGATTLALTNINSTCDIWDFVDFCKQNFIKPVAGAEIRNDSSFLYILLAKNNNGFQQINCFISEHLQSKTDFPTRPSFTDDVFVIFALNALRDEELGSNELIGIQPTEVNKLYNFNVGAYADKYVIRQPVTFKDKPMYKSN
jgi:DNA polymerase III alpha subunit